MKIKKTYSKHDLRRKIEELGQTVYYIADRLRTVEVLFNDYIDMQDNDNKFKEFLDGKYKQPEHKSSGRDSKTSE
tara:strand:- start:504 stop:728 length:225 start_codon:yes stop_codon:yes gene_type:complete